MAQDTVVVETKPEPAKKMPAPGALASLAKVDSRGPLSAFIVVASFIGLTLVSEPVNSGTRMPWTINPTGYLGQGWYVLLYVVTIPAKEVMNHVLSILAASILGFKRMDEGEGKVRKLEVLEAVDLCYLALNTMVEFIGMNHIASVLLGGPLEYRLSGFTIFNGPLAFLVVMCLNDIIYYPFHLVAHRRTFYPYCHKQHHRQFVPFRGYADAANQHPFEQMYGFCIFITSLHLTAKITGVHAATAWVAALCWAILNIANHLAFDSKLHLPLPYPAFPRDHQMHHRFPQCNYSTLTTFCDRACGTFRPYKDLCEKAGEPPSIANKEGKEVDAPSEGGRPEALPSPYSVLFLAVALSVAAVALETYFAGDLPNPQELAYLLRSVVLCINVALACSAIEAAMSTSNEKEVRHSKLVEAVPDGHVKTFVGGKEEWKASLAPEKPKPYRRT